MSTDIVKYAFIAGEISPTLIGRTDLTKYDLAVAEGLNFFVDYRGGLSSRPGTQFIDTAWQGELETRMFPFNFAPDVANSYAVFFGHNYIRFYQNGGLVYNGPNVYEVATPFEADDLGGLVVEQYRDLLRITSLTFPIYNLIRHDHTNWELVEEAVSPYIEGVEITDSEFSNSGSAEVVFAVTKVLEDGSESVAGPPFKLTGTRSYSAEPGSVSVMWGADPDAIYYNIYRSVIVGSNTSLSSGSPLGFIGRAHGTKFTDPNLIPDFTHVPPTHHNPFAPGAIEKIVVTGVGAGNYNDFSAEISITDPTGSGFDGHIVIDDNGDPQTVVVNSGGEGYTAPVVNVTTGTGATFDVTVNELTGVYPSLSCVFQQRQIYAATENDPITIWGSRIKQFSNFSSSDFVLDDDAFEFSLDTNAVAPIRHLIVTHGGLLAMTQNDVWLLNGSGNVNAPLTPTNALAEPQSYTGVSALKPLAIGSDLLFAEGKGHAIRTMLYNELGKSYTSEDRSILSSHLFGPGKDIIRWGYQESPFKIVWAVREDGALLAFTTIKSEEVYAWTPCATKGKFTDICVVQEGIEDRVYVTVERKIDGTWVKFVEQLDLRQYVNVEDAWCVDCGLSLPATYPPGELIILHDNDTDVWTLQFSQSHVFAVDDFVRGGNGIFKITAGSGTSYTARMFAEPTNWIPETNETETFPIEEGSWTCDTPVDTLSGLDHLEGQEVAILADGNVFPRQTVVGGAVQLNSPVTRAIVGLPFTCRAKTLPIIVPQAGIESKRKRIVGIGIRQDKSRGIKIGPTLDDMYPMRERTDEDYGQATRLVGGMRYQLVEADWNEEGQTYFVQEDPLPVNILSIVSDVEVGDEPD